MKILQNDLKRQYELYAKEYDQKALEVLKSGWYILGNEVKQFEEEFSNYLNCKHCVGVASGMDALEIAFRIIGIKENDEVIVCSNSYIACVMGITMNRGTPIFVEPDEYDNLDANKIEEKITDKTKAILAVHLYGQSCDMDKIMDIARRHGLKVVEDAAQGVNAMYKDKYLGTIGDFGCYSFHETKNYSMSEGGAIVINNKAYNEKAEVLREEVLKDLKAAGTIDLPFIPDYDKHNAHMFYIKCKDLQERTALISYLKENGICAVFHYVPLRSRRIQIRQV